MKVGILDCFASSEINSLCRITPCPCKTELYSLVHVALINPSGPFARLLISVAAACPIHKLEASVCGTAGNFQRLH